MHHNYDYTSFIILILIVCFIVIYFTINIVISTHERSQILIEIERSEGKERKRWERKLKKIYINMIPIIGKLITKYIYK